MDSNIDLSKPETMIGIRKHHPMVLVTKYKMYQREFQYHFCDANHKICSAYRTINAVDMTFTIMIKYDIPKTKNESIMVISDLDIKELKKIDCLQFYNMDCAFIDVPTEEKDRLDKIFAPKVIDVNYVNHKKKTLCGFCSKQVSFRSHICEKMKTMMTLNNDLPYNLDKMQYHQSVPGTDAGILHSQLISGYCRNKIYCPCWSGGYRSYERSGISHKECLFNDKLKVFCRNCCRLTIEGTKHMCKKKKVVLTESPCSDNLEKFNLENKNGISLKELKKNKMNVYINPKTEVYHKRRIRLKGEKNVFNKFLSELVNAVLFGEEESPEKLINKEETLISNEIYEDTSHERALILTEICKLKKKSVGLLNLILTQRRNAFSNVFRR